MILALVGSGEYLPPIEELDRDLISRLNEPPRIVCLPTAAGKEAPERIDYWMRLGIEHFTRLGAQVSALPVIDRTSAQNPIFAAETSKANFIYLSGGTPDYLYKSLAGTLVWEAVCSILENGGLLAGCSAGAMVMGEKYLGFPGLKTGFNFLPGAVILPHYDEFPKAASKVVRWLIRRSMTLVGIEGNTAFVRNRDRYEVLGSGGVTLWNKSGKRRFTSGPLERFP